MTVRFSVLAVLACYAVHVFRGHFIYEDAAWLGMLTEGTRGWWQPRGLSRMLWAAEWWIAPSPRTFHAVSLGLHALNAVLVGVLARRIGLSARYARLAAVIVFVHWLGIETVTYAAQQGELLAAAGVLGACILASDRWWRPHVFLGIVACLLFGIWGKETAAVGIGLVVFVAVLQRQKPPAEAAIYGALALWMFGLVLMSRLPGGFGLFNIGESAGVNITALDWLLVQSAAAVRSLVLLVLPLGLTVDFDYDLVPMGIRWFAFCLLVAFSVHVWFLRRVWPMGAFCGAWILVVLLPRLVVQTPRGYLNDHQFYLAIPAFGLMVAAVLESFKCRNTVASLS